MNTKLTLRSIFMAALLLGWASASSALSIGPLSGASVVGQPLELTARIQFDEVGSGSASNCVAADFLYGDRLVDRAKVQVDLVPDASRQSSLARISSTAIVDEPVVTLLLRAGCGTQTTRRYVLLSESPSEQPLVLGAVSSLSLQTTVAPPPGDAQRKPAARSVVLKAPRPAAAEHRPATRSIDTGLRSSPRLQLAVWEPGSETSPWLRASAELASTPAANPAHRAAATALWRALNAQPADLLRTADRLRGLEGEVSSLRSLAVRHRAEISSARESLLTAQSQRHTSLALAACLAMLAGGAGAFFWHRSRHAAVRGSPTSWYAPDGPQRDANVVEHELAALPAVAPEPESTQQEPAPVPAPAQQPAPVAYRESVPGLPLNVPPLFIAPAIHEPAESFHFSGGRQDRVDALHGAQQQAEFFASLGQFDESLAVLTAYIDESSEQPPLAFLELFRIYRALGMRIEYEELQSRYRHTFGMDTASFTEYKDDRRELELFLVPLARISAAWPSVAGQEIIEEILFKKPPGPREVLSIDAYRELLWLHSLGQELLHSTGKPAGLQLIEDRGLPNDHFILPWAVGNQDRPDELSLDRLNAIDVATGSNGFAVDIDLTALPGDALQQSWHDEGKAQPLPEVPPLPAPQAAPEPNGGMDMFDAVMESESRKLFR